MFDLHRLVIFLVLIVFLIILCSCCCSPRTLICYTDGGQNGEIGIYSNLRQLNLSAYPDENNRTPSQGEVDALYYAVRNACELPRVFTNFIFASDLIYFKSVYEYMSYTRAKKLEANKLWDSKLIDFIQAQWDRLQVIFKLCTVSSTSVYFLYVPAHTGDLIGNELADTLTKLPRYHSYEKLIYNRKREINSPRRTQLLEHKLTCFEIPHDASAEWTEDDDLRASELFPEINKVDVDVAQLENDLYPNINIRHDQEKLMHLVHAMHENHSDPVFLGDFLPFRPDTISSH